MSDLFKYFRPIQIFQTYSKEAVEHVQEALTMAQRSKTLDKDIFEVTGPDIVQ
jgi:hypothetical protein